MYAIQIIADISYMVYILFSMWRIEEHRRIDKQIASVPNDILKGYEKWRDIASISGPPGLRLINGFHDEALSGRWKGYRSSRLGVQWWLICRVMRTPQNTPPFMAGMNAARG